MGSVLATMRRWLGLGGVLGAPLLAAACTPNAPLYVPLPTTGDHGYVDRPLGGQQYEVTFVAPRDLTLAITRSARDAIAERRLGLAFDMALWRSSELALQEGYPAFHVVNRSNDVRVQVQYDYTVGPSYPYCNPLLSAHYGCFYDPFAAYGPFDRTAEIEARVTLTIQLEHEVKPGSGFYDAKSTISRFQATYPKALMSGEPLG